MRTCVNREQRLALQRQAHRCPPYPLLYPDLPTSPFPDPDPPHLPTLPWLSPLIQFQHSCIGRPASTPLTHQPPYSATRPDSTPLTHQPPYSATRPDSTPLTHQPPCSASCPASTPLTHQPRCSASRLTSTPLTHQPLCSAFRSAGSRGPCGSWSLGRPCSHGFLVCPSDEEGVWREGKVWTSGRSDE